MHPELLFKYIDIHSHGLNTQSTDLIRIQNIFYQDFSKTRDEQFYASVGLHPWHTADHSINDQEFIKYITHPRIVAIGEIGLDKIRNVRFDRQVEVLLQQIRLAQEFTNKPLIIHCVKAFAELLAIKKNSNSKQTWIIHGFSGKAGLANQLIQAGFILSFGESLLSASYKHQEAFKATPIEHLFLETDESQIGIEAIYEKAAQLKCLSIHELKKRINQNFQKYFSK
ncbi:MAG: TatD family deoxyribonuclease [Bacteroidetes bacterium]|jgi:TatD DNase family protein|nr:TatD family deoxyribonuclease [Bacteroidota bacterium]MBT4401078.1 TatD family deoxyribonuclease [Bacteroidota bacterium]MBT4408640.1 TatD family deoxyribonuclease [Bacteroidota bacterium]MBT5427970.1 TatD family deoxyribonuclease [Bacteroidota bacterium]MBT7092234.1 TatD family deoxyribonuclease [Bacteroidota bacterium]